ncbi:ABC-type uncharacterized transport system substrate-binding protein [Desulfobaculum xiamenense]|uniref:ABC-type uncharacterized transport system substrate-binding protein n=1 Tax=Desulfobaculum xiamenense TaxID=995050 RepID=A0A846QWX4_9BACT|nr:DUF1007 family protein [Desulfobaculum xiamenense]NJB69119.1 ABC-type uncharacterized transport system substrate-binding protein [Desulfobaculum xiamenense]
MPCAIFARKWAILLAALFLICVRPATGAAHPHVFADNAVTFVFDGGELTGIRLVWHFDEMFGATLLEDYDANHDGAFDAAERRTLKSEAFDNLRNYGYFTYLTVGGTRKPVSQVADFGAGVDGDGMYYSFVVPCRVPAGTEVRLAVFDPEYYVDFYTPEDSAVSVEGASALSVRHAVAPNPNLTFSTWLVTPTEITLSFHK